MKNLFWIVLMGMTLMACVDDAAEEQKNLLLGKWDLVLAERGGKPTDTLRGLYFEFGEDGIIKTNLMTVDEEGTYEVKENIIEQRNTRMDVDYTLEELSSSTLILTTNLRNTDFKFVLGRAIEQ